MIKKLDNSNEEVANKIFAIFQKSYKIEAQIVGAVNFPPLLRSVKDIRHSNALFYGFIESESLAAVIEVVIDKQILHIDSLTVDPYYFRKGFAKKLLNYALNEFHFSEAIVETAVLNSPAISLYKKYGFIEFKRWTPSHGIEKLAMAVKNTTQ